MEDVVGKKNFFQYFVKETFSDTVGGALVFRKMNQVGLTMIHQCTFKNNFGPEGGSISMTEGGVLYGTQNKFSLDKEF